ncbi:unnamed protein product [Closterium sp. Yama58-4]|nr:unnamed protein product [Closterium sp. Yama58-4]
MMLKVVRYSAPSYRVLIKMRFLNLKGGDMPMMAFGASCPAIKVSAPVSMTNITSANAARHKRYSFAYDQWINAVKEADARAALASVVTSSHVVVGQKQNLFALCGKVVKVK